MGLGAPPAAARTPARAARWQEVAAAERVELQPVELQPAEPQRVELRRAEPQRAERQRVERQRVEPQRVEPQRAEPQRAELQRAERRRAERQRVELRRAERQRAERQRVEPQRVEPAEGRVAFRRSPTSRQGTGDWVRPSERSLKSVAETQCLFFVLAIRVLVKVGANTPSWSGGTGQPRRLIARQASFLVSRAMVSWSSHPSKPWSTRIT
jgi:hypothetical protein